MILGPNGPFTNLPPTLETQVEWISDFIGNIRNNGNATAEASQEAEEAWTTTCREIANTTLFSKADSWIFGTNIPGKKSTVQFYLGGLGNYTNELRNEALTGYKNYVFKSSNEL